MAILSKPWYLSLLSFLLTCFSLTAQISQVNELSLEEKVGQLLIVHFNGKEFNADAQLLIEQAHVGGFILYNWANGLEDPKQVQQLTQGLQKAAFQQKNKLPLFIAIDQEGGLVARLRKGFTQFPGNYALGQTKQPQLAAESAKAMGEELRLVGINLNLAPVVDINSNPLNPVIGIRSFGVSASEVVRFGEKALEGYRQSSIITAIKHFPGHGDVAVDSHAALPIIKKSREELEKTDLLPFKKLASQADAILTAHLLVPALDPVNCITLSKSAIDGLLRTEWNYQGVVITDSLIMQGVLDCTSSLEEAAIRSLIAGHDIVLLGGRQLLANQPGREVSVENVLHIHRAILEAIKQGRLKEAQIDRSVERILKLKNHYQLADSFSLNSPEIEQTAATENHQKLAQKIAKKSIHLTSCKMPIPLNLTHYPVLVIAPQILSEDLLSTTIAQIGQNTDLYFFEEMQPTQEEQQEALNKAQRADYIVMLTYNGWKNRRQIELVDKMSTLNKPMIVLVVGNPQDSTLVSHQAKIVLQTFSPTAVSIQAALNFLMDSL